MASLSYARELLAIICQALNEDAISIYANPALAKICGLDNLWRKDDRDHRIIDLDKYLAGWRSAHGASDVLPLTHCQQWCEFIRLNNTLVSASQLICAYIEVSERVCSRELPRIKFDQPPFAVSQEAYESGLAKCASASRETRDIFAPLYTCPILFDIPEVTADEQSFAPDVMGMLTAYGMPAEAIELAQK
jgi:hypothetical protein